MPRRGLAPAGTAAARVDLHDRVTQIPFLFTLYYSTLSWNLVRPGSRRFVGLNNYIAVVQDSQFWQVAVNTVVLIVGVGAGLGAARFADRPATGSRVPGPRCGANAADHTVPDHPRCGSADLEDHDPRPEQRHPQLGAVAGRVGPRRLDRSVPADHGDGRVDLAVDAVHDAADPRRPDSRCPATNSRPAGWTGRPRSSSSAS